MKGLAEAHFVTQVSVQNTQTQGGFTAPRPIQSLSLLNRYRGLQGSHLLSVQLLNVNLSVGLYRKLVPNLFI